VVQIFYYLDLLTIEITIY